MPITQTAASFARGSILLPDKLYWTDAGLDRFIYFDDILRCGCPSLVDIHCDVLMSGVLRGDHNATHLIVPAAETLPVGNHVNALEITASIDGRTVATKRCDVQVTAAGSALSRRVLAIGDSNTASGTWVTSLQALSGPDLTFVGTQGSDPTKREGHSGKTFSWFRTDPASPLTHNGSLDFANYLTANSITLAAGDSIVVMLGTNDFLNVAPTVLQQTISDRLADVAALVAEFQTVVPGINVLLCPVITVSATQNDFGSNYGTGSERDRGRRNYQLWNQRLIREYDTAAHRAAGRYVLATHALIDPAGFTANAVHPDAAQLQRVGDAVYQTLKFLG